MKPRTLFFTFVVTCTIIFSLLFFRAQGDHTNKNSILPTYYSYSAPDLHSIFSTYLISDCELQKWDAALEEYFTKHPIPIETQQRIYTYLYNAQRDAAFLSYNHHECFIGNLDPISLKMIHLFLPNFTPSFSLEGDDYSKEIAQIVFPKYETRFQQEEKNPQTYPKWGEDQDQADMSIAKWIPWILPISEYHLPMPPPPEDAKAWKKELKELKKARRYLNEKEMACVLNWGSGEPGTKNWRVIANDCLWENCSPIGKALYVRSALMIGLYDATITSNNAKYMYLIPRPYTMDPGIIPLVHKPGSPSYPSGTATRAYAAYEILSYFFARECQDWQKLAAEASQSRIWAGVHFPIDIQGGETLGKEIGNAVVEHLAEQH